MKSSFEKLLATLAGARQWVTDHGHTLIAVKPYSAHPDDHYLAVVLYRHASSNETRPEFVVHTYNEEQGGCPDGGYGRDLARALIRFAKRGPLHEEVPSELIFARVDTTGSCWGAGEAEKSAAVARYLPSNYLPVRVVIAKVDGSQTNWFGNGEVPLNPGEKVIAVYISGRDNAGWTLDTYVIPRLLSGGYPCHQVASLPPLA